MKTGFLADDVSHQVAVHRYCVTKNNEKLKGEFHMQSFEMVWHIASGC